MRCFARMFLKMDREGADLTAIGKRFHVDAPAKERLDLNMSSLGSGMMNKWFVLPY